MIDICSNCRKRESFQNDQCFVCLLKEIANSLTTKDDNPEFSINYEHASREYLIETIGELRQDKTHLLAVIAEYRRYFKHKDSRNMKGRP